jgi:hypothetical protein
MVLPLVYVPTLFGADIGTSRWYSSRMSNSSGADRGAPHCYPSPVTTPEPDAGKDGDAILRAAGINVTEEGKARFRRRLEEADAKWTPERRAELRRQLGLPEAAA